MRFTLTMLLLLLLVVGCLATYIGCTHVPRAPKESDSVMEMRGQYLEDHPNGPYNDRIRNGELVKGMNVLEVLASWGPPDRRVWSTRDERWTYSVTDEYSRDSVHYTLVFQDRLLRRWDMERVTAAMGFNVPDDRARQSEPPEGSGGASSGAPPKK